MEEARARAVDERVARLVRDGLAPAGNALHHAGRLVAALHHVEEHELSLARDAVVARDDAAELRDGSRQRPRVEERVRPVGVRAVERLLVGAVHVHRHHHAREVVGAVGVLPPEVEDAAVVHHHGAPAVVLVEHEALHRAVLLEKMRVAHVVGAAHAGNAVEAACGDEEHAPVGKVAGIVAVDVVTAGRRLERLREGPVERRLDDAPSLFAVESAGVGDLLCVEVEVDVAEEVVGRGDRAPALAGAAADWHRDDGVDVALQRHGRIALPVVRQAGVRSPAALHHQEMGEVHAWMAQIHVLLQLHQRCGRLEPRVVVLRALHARLHLRELREKRVGRAVRIRIFRGVGADCALHCLGVEPLQRAKREQLRLVGAWRQLRRAPF